MNARIAVIGAGMAGLTLAHALRNNAHVSVFEKARGVGGRMSTRYAEPFCFDHGAQFFTARDTAFQEYLKPLVAEGLVAPWTGKVITLEADRRPTDRLWFEPHYVAVPNMNSLCKSLAASLNVACGVEVVPLVEKASDGWHVTAKDGRALGVFDWVVSTAPPAQTERLFAGHLPPDHPLGPARLLGCYTLMIGFNRPWQSSWMGARIQNSPLEWIAINSTKPGRNAAVTSIVAHSSNAWAEAHIDDAMETAEGFLRQEFERVTGMDTRDAAYFSSHRWRYAQMESAQPQRIYMDALSGLASTGDWSSASRIEDAWLNASQLAQQIENALA